MNYYSIIYYKYGDYEQAYDLINYTKEGKIIDSESIAYAGGDGDFLYDTRSTFINDSTVSLSYREGFLKDIYDYSENNQKKIENQYKLRITIQNDGKIKVDTIK